MFSRESMAASSQGILSIYKLVKAAWSSTYNVEELGCLRKGQGTD